MLDLLQFCRSRAKARARARANKFDLLTLVYIMGLKLGRSNFLGGGGVELLLSITRHGTKGV